MLVCGVTYGDWWEDFSKAKESGVGSAWLKLNPGARGVALGDAYLSIAKGPEAIFWNPAGIGTGTGWKANFTHWQHFQGLRYEILGLSTTRGRNAYGIGLAGVFAGKFEHRNEKQNLLGEYNAYDFLGSFSYTRNLDKGLYFGGTIKWIYEQIYVYRLSNVALDFGVNYNIYPNLWIGGTLVNLGSSSAFEEENIKLPRCWKVGANYEKDNILISLDINKYIDAVLEAGIGTEYKINPIFCVRTGYRMDCTGEYSLSCGFGVKFKEIELDYAFKPYSLGLGNAHILTLTR